jgi:hypothetical protein
MAAVPTFRRILVAFTATTRGEVLPTATSAARASFATGRRPHHDGDIQYGTPVVLPCGRAASCPDCPDLAKAADSRDVTTDFFDMAHLASCDSLTPLSLRKAPDLRRRLCVRRQLACDLAAFRSQASIWAGWDPPNNGKTIEVRAGGRRLSTPLRQGSCRRSPPLEHRSRQHSSLAGQCAAICHPGLATRRSSNPGPREERFLAPPLRRRGRRSTFGPQN